MTGLVSAVAITAALVAEATGGRLTAGAPGTVFSAVSIDSRTIQPGALFVAIHGDRFDGHDYVVQAVERGASGVMASKPVEARGAAILTVDDTLAALQGLGREIRRRSGATVVAITGSAGKTSTKEITADLLATKHRVFRNRGNLNNHIGLPLSLVELASGPDMAVVELGMNHAGEIRELIGIAEPDARVWTNVGDAHIGHFGSREAVASAKAEILEGAGPKTLLVLNADDPLVMSHARDPGGRVVTFGFSEASAVRAEGFDDRGFEGTTATVTTTRGQVRVELSLPGRAQLMNVLAAIAVAVEYGVDLERIPAAVAAARPVARRGAIHVTSSGARIVDDTYNASPEAVHATLQALAATPNAVRRIAVLGEMRELGDRAFDLHEACGRAAYDAGVDILVAVGGPAADGLVAGARAAGMAQARILRFADAPSACASVAALLRRGDLVLVKGSRGTRMDIVADALVAERQG
ncbi:MAG TPA: UDP-N-acetylmuramoyl-tripeptide--D-alanyl-D-alanine ligase [Vicinamibacterales bacterium]|nr:UDP-N-acetylmuramoyl-tripeptide--D-alanyl-D-alanine ligase [Vicinamibacterales bacterium]